MGEEPTLADRPHFDFSKYEANVVEAARILEPGGSVPLHVVQEGLNAATTLDDPAKAALRSLVMAKIQHIVRTGSWRDLRGGNELLALLGIESIEFSDKWIKMIDSFHRRFSLDLLRDMDPSLVYTRRFLDVGSDDQAAYTRARLRLREAGVLEDELTDEFIENLWSVHALLMKLYYSNSVKQGRLNLHAILALSEDL